MPGATAPVEERSKVRCPGSDAGSSTLTLFEDMAQGHLKLKSCAAHRCGVANDLVGLPFGLFLLITCLLY